MTDDDFRSGKLERLGEVVPRVLASALKARADRVKWESEGLRRKTVKPRFDDPELVKYFDFKL